MSKVKVLTKKEMNNIGILPFQRQASVRSSLVNSMKQYGFLGSILMIKTSVISGVEKLYIIDGQHRFLAARFLDIPIMANIIETNKSKEELIYLISTLNSTGVRWKIEDYVNAYASLNNDNYVKLLQLSKECKKLSIAKILWAWNPDLALVRKGKMIVSKEVLENIKALDDILYKIPKQSYNDLVPLYNIIKEKSFNIEVFKKKYIENISILTALVPTEKEKIYKSWF